MDDSRQFSGSAGEFWMVNAIDQPSFPSARLRPVTDNTSAKATVCPASPSFSSPSADISAHVTFHWLNGSDWPTTLTSF